MVQNPDTDRAFQAGDYMGVAVRADSSEWQYHAARGLIVDPAAGIDGLARFDQPDARFFSAVLSWMDGDEDTACRALERIQTPRADSLLALVRRRRIRVLSMLPPVRHGAFVLREGIRHDAKFEVVNVGFYPDDVPERPYASVVDYLPSIDWPDLFVSQVMEWHQTPVDLHRLPCPTIGFTNDLDAHIQGLRQWFDAFDVRVVIDHAYEWPTIRAISGDPTLSFPLVFGVSDSLPAVESSCRDIDVLFSGTLVSSYNPEKEKLVGELLRIPDLKIVLIDGHVNDAAYFQLLGRTKITPSFCRHRGGIQTRVIESLSMGSISLVQPDSIMQLWADRSTGLWEYDERLGPVPQIREILADYDRHARGCVAQARSFRSSFDARKTASRLFRFCAFAATAPHTRRPPVPGLTQKRVMFAHGPSTSHAYAVELAQSNASRMTQSRAYASGGLDAAREWLLVYARALYDNRTKGIDPGHLALAVDGYRHVVEAFPRNLVARFNLFRVLLHFGSPAQHLEARQVLACILADAAAEWEISPGDDVLPYDFMPEWFNYRAYLDLVVEAHATGVIAHDRMRDLIVAAAYHYRAIRDRSAPDAAAAVDLDPVFTPYRLTLGELLARHGDDAARARAVEILSALADGSNTALRAGRLLHALAEQGCAVPSRALEAASTIAGRIRLRLLQTEHHHLKVTAPYFVAERVREDWRAGVVTHVAHASSDRKYMSVVVCGYHGWQSATLLRQLRSQTIPPHLYEIVYVDCYGEPPPDVMAHADVVLSLNQRELLDSAATAWLLGLEHAHAQVVAIVQPGCGVDRRFVETLAGAFYVNPIGTLETGEARSIAVIGTAAADDRSSPQFVAFRARDGLRAGALDEAEVFRGDGSALTHLCDRLGRIGVPRAVLEESRLSPAGRARWWSYNPMLERSGRIAASRVIWPDLFDGNGDLLWKVKSPSLVHRGAIGNVVRLGAAYFVAPSAIGPVDWKSVVLRNDPPLRAEWSLGAAIRCVGSRNPNEV